MILLPCGDVTHSHKHTQTKTHKHTQQFPPFPTVTPVRFQRHEAIYIYLHPPNLIKGLDRRKGAGPRATTAHGRCASRTAARSRWPVVPRRFLSHLSSSLPVLPPSLRPSLSLSSYRRKTTGHHADAADVHVSGGAGRFLAGEFSRPRVLERTTTVGRVRPRVRNFVTGVKYFNRCFVLVRCVP